MSKARHKFVACDKVVSCKFGPKKKSGIYKPLRSIDKQISKTNAGRGNYVITTYSVPDLCLLSGCRCDVNTPASLGFRSQQQK